MGLWFGFVSEHFLVLSQLSFLCCCSQDNITGDENSNIGNICFTWHKKFRKCLAIKVIRDQMIFK